MSTRNRRNRAGPSRPRAAQPSRSRRRGGVSNPVSYSVRSGTARRGIKIEPGSDTFVAAVTGDIAFSSDLYRVNPGLADRNLALSKEAQKYDQYRFRKLHFRYIPSDAVTSTKGLIGLALDPNPNTAPPAALTRFNAYEISTFMRSVYAKDTILRVHPSALGGFRFVRCGPKGTDLSIYDIGSLIVATQGLAGDGDPLGLIEIHYEVEFRHYHLEPALPLPSSLTVYNLSADQTLANTVAEVVEPDESVANGLGIVPASGIFTLPCGQYTVRYELAGTDSADEDFYFNARLFKDSAAMVPPVVTVSSGSDSLYAAATLTGYIVSDGTNTVSCSVIMYGATGTLKLTGDRCRVFITALT